MISNEEMYEFASQIAGITDNDLQQYKCGGKAKKMKKDCKGAKMEEGGQTPDAKTQQPRKFSDYMKKEQKKKYPNPFNKQKSDSINSKSPEQNTFRRGPENGMDDIRRKKQPHEPDYA